MKKWLVALLATLSFAGASAQKMITRSGEISFEASMPALEEIAAKTNTASCLFDTSTGEFVSLVLVKAFHFKVPLMEEHFNENYMESDKYPKATFKGKVSGFNPNSKQKQVCEVEGDLTIHNVTKHVKTTMTFVPSGDKLSAKGTFSVKPQDYGISIPAVVKNKIADKVNIVLSFDLEKKV